MENSNCVCELGFQLITMMMLLVSEPGFLNLSNCELL